MSGSYVIKLKTGASKTLRGLLTWDRLWIDEYTGVHPSFNSNFLRFDYNAGRLHWATAILEGLIERGYVECWESEPGSKIWNKKLHPDNRPHAWILYGDTRFNIPPPKMPAKDRQYYIDEVENYKQKLKEVFGELE